MPTLPYSSVTAAEQAAPLVQLRRLLDQRRIERGTVFRPQDLGHRQQLVRALGATRPEQLVDPQQQLLRHADQLGGALQVTGERRPTGGARDLRLRAQPVGRDGQIARS